MHSEVNRIRALSEKSSDLVVILRTRFNNIISMPACTYIAHTHKHEYEIVDYA